jgi:glycosyltransferase involved in cell wall biosynthesis
MNFSMIVPAYPTCSLTMIVRNEAANIGAVLDCAEGFVDDIVVVDTGSTDDTVAIATSRGARVICRSWDDDFSAARNEAIEAARGDVILWLDADDRVEAADMAAMRDIWRSRPGACHLFRIVNQANQGTANEFMQARLFPRREDVRFERRIHEQIMASAKRAGIPFVTHPEIGIRHTGYDDESIHRVKAGRNRRMIETEIAALPDDPSLWLSLGDACMILQDWPKAVDAYRMVLTIENSWSINRDVYVQAMFCSALAFLNLGNRREARRWLYRCLYHDPSRIEAYGVLGSLLKADGDLVAAGKCFIRAACIDPPVRLTATDNKRMKVQAIFNLAEIFLFQKNYAAARELLQNALQKNPRIVPFYNQLGKVYLGLSELVEASKSFMQSIALAPHNNPEPYRGMAEVYKILGDETKAARFSEFI